jgi:methyltransferase (TIGR00027 family)
VTVTSIVITMPEPTGAHRRRLSNRTTSATALGAAGLRAAHLLLDDPPPVFRDPLALRLLEAGADRTILEQSDRFRTPASRAIRSDVLVRSRYAEDRLAEGVRQGIRQYVILGAGLDTFAYRQPPWARDLQIIEVDHAGSGRDKRERLDRAGITVPPNVHYASTDLEVDALGSVLQEAGLNTSRPVFVACLGVLIYLSAAAAETIFATAGNLPPSSEFVFTFSRPDASTAGPPAAGSAAARVAAAGEPWRTRFEPDVVVARLRAAGFRSVSLLVAGDITERYLHDRIDGLRAPARGVIADAVV